MNTAFIRSAKLSTTYAPPNIDRSCPSTANVNSGTSAASRPIPAIDDMAHFVRSPDATSTSNNTTIVTTSTTSGARPCQSTPGRTKPTTEPIVATGALTKAGTMSSAQRGETVDHGRVGDPEDEV